MSEIRWNLTLKGEYNNAEMWYMQWQRFYQMSEVSWQGAVKRGLDDHIYGSMQELPRLWSGQVWCLSWEGLDMNG